MTDDVFYEATKYVPEAPNCVTVFGGGIAGLTVAHELVERGFHVQVWEPEDDQRDFRRGCQVGGMARTQWSRVHWPELRDIGQPPSLDATPSERAVAKPSSFGMMAQKIVPIEQKFYLHIEEGKEPVVLAALGDDGVYLGEKQVTAVLNQVLDILNRYPEILHVYAELCLSPDLKAQQLSGPGWEKRFLDTVNQVLEKFRSLVKDTPVGVGDASFTDARRVVLFLTIPGRTRQVRFEITALGNFPTAYVPPETNVIIGFRVREYWLPGEHGYRFFPSFYRHVFDTMGRIPLLDPVKKTDFAIQQERAAAIPEPEPFRHKEDGRTAYDNLRPLTGQVLAFTNGNRPDEFSRFRPRSFEEVREYIKVIFSSDDKGGFGLDPRDAMRVTLRAMQFLTSSSARRQDYERVSWWDFVKGETLGAGAKRMIERWPRALVAMDAHSSDARTFGIGLTQLVLDLYRPDGFRDGTLKGPTNDAWLDPWRRYLEAQGVEFIHGKLNGFTLLDTPKGKRRVWPLVECYEPRYALKKVEPDRAALAADEPDTETPPPPELLPGYFVVAVPPLQGRAVAKTYCTQVYGGVAAAPEGSDLAKLARFASGVSDHDIQDPRRQVEDFRHFVGIQYYFAEDVFWADGHTYYPDSEWALTSVSQARFWEDRTDWEHGYRGILSVIIGDWETPGIKVKKPASQCSKDDLAREVWEQIKKSVQRDVASRSTVSTQQPPYRRTVGSELPNPIYWHIDDNLENDESPFVNRSPFPITAPGAWDLRPGAVDDQYVVENAIVLAGAHLKTFTRLTTMESANESGRRAVNAILVHGHDTMPEQSIYRRTLCDLWNPEENEVADFQWFKDLDAKLHGRGVQHVFEVYGLDALARDLLKGGPGDPFDPVVLIGRLRTLIRRMSEGRRREA
jgi:uncharacterized protein with NAD-binding domain and iron-sulfur cluster